jgi:hypothetical protein
VKLVGVLVKGDENIAAVAQRVDRLVGDADLKPSVPALNLGRVGAEREGAKAYAGGGGGEILAGADDAADGGVAADSDDEIVSCQGRAPLVYTPLPA